MNTPCLLDPMTLDKQWNLGVMNILEGGGADPPPPAEVPSLVLHVLLNIMEKTKKPSQNVLQCLLWQCLNESAFAMAVFGIAVHFN